MTYRTTAWIESGEHLAGFLCEDTLDHAENFTVKRAKGAWPVKGPAKMQPAN
jgi:hypothetical protein